MKFLQLCLLRSSVLLKANYQHARSLSISRMNNRLLSPSTSLPPLSFIYRYLSTQPFTRKPAIKPSQPTFDFLQEAMKFIEITRVAVEPLQDLNEMDIISSPDSLTVDFGKTQGQYTLKVDRENQRLNLLSPVSGIIQYYFEPESAQWLSSTDNHDIRGLITRDMLRHCRGCPKF